MATPFSIPLPPCGGGAGVGGRRDASNDSGKTRPFSIVRPYAADPHPLPPPRKGDGEGLRKSCERNWRAATAAILAFALAACSPAADSPEPLTILAAASLTDALETIGDTYTAETGQPVVFSFASSSTLARQIEAGAPAAIFASANDEWMDYLGERDLIEADTRVSPIGNRLVLVAPADSPITDVAVGPDLDLPALLGPDGRLAVGDPAHVPAGQYAQAALTSLGLWNEVEDRLAPGADVRAALALVSRGETPLGIVYSTDAGPSSGVKIVGTFPESSHEPITYPFAILAGARTEAAEEFLAYATGAPGLAVFENYGFVRR